MVSTQFCFCWLPVLCCYCFYTGKFMDIKFIFPISSICFMSRFSDERNFYEKASIPPCFAIKKFLRSVGVRQNKSRSSFSHVDADVDDDDDDDGDERDEARFVVLLRCSPAGVWKSLCTKGKPTERAKSTTFPQQPS